MSTDETSTDRVRRYLLAGSMALCPVLLMAGTALEFETGEAGSQELAAVAADTGRFYASTLLLALGLALLTPTALGLMQLARGRGGTLTTVGGCLLFVAGTATATGITMYGVMTTVASDPALPRDTMAQFAEAAGESGYAAPPFVVGFFGMAIGLVVTSIGLVRAGTVPVWMPVLLGVGAVTTFLTSDAGWPMLLAVSPLLVLVGLAVEVARPDRTVVLPDLPGQRPADEPAARHAVG
jgi:hypothetical protein